MLNMRHLVGRRWLNPAAADAVCGAIGEVAQLVCLYPVDTLKVLCQAQGTGVGGVVLCLRARNLGPARLLSTLYAGCGAAAVASVLIGSAYLVSFYHLQRMMTRCGQAKPPLIIVSRCTLYQKPWQTAPNPCTLY